MKQKEVVIVKIHPDGKSCIDSYGNEYSIDNIIMQQSSKKFNVWVWAPNDLKHRRIKFKDGHAEQQVESRLSIDNMLHIYVNKIPDKFIRYSDAEQIFSNILMKNTVFDDPLSREVMKEIDGVTVKNGLYIETKFGNCSLYQLQTGAKQVLNALYYRDTNIIVPLVEAGPNAIYTLMDISRREGLNTNVYMYDWIEAMDKDDFDCYLDGERITSSMDLCAKICGWE